MLYPTLRSEQNGASALDEEHTQIAISALRDAVKDRASPVDICFGTKPSHERAQQAAMPVLGFLSSRSPAESADSVAAFRQGLREVGFIEGQNLLIAFRWAEGRYDRLRQLAADLVDLRV